MFVFFYASNAQIHDGRMWYCGECSPKVVGNLRQIPRDGSTWKAKANYQQKDYNIELKFIDSVTFIYTWTNKFDGITDYTVGKVNDEDSLVFHGFACSITNEGDTLLRKYYKNNRLHGPYWSIDPNDSIERITHYEEGLCQGAYKMIKHEQIFTDGQFKDGKRTGVWKYYESGKLLFKGTYSGEGYYGWVPDLSGVFSEPGEVSAYIPIRTGRWYFYNPSGKVIRIEVYSKSGVIKRMVFKSQYRRSPIIQDMIVREVYL